MPSLASINVLHRRTAIYTQDPVVQSLLDLLDWPRGERRLIEPSCGDGAFLVAALRRILAAEPGIDAVRLASILHAYEVHPGAAEEARSRLAFLLMEEGWRPADAAKCSRSLVETADFLTDGPPPGSCDVVAGNPPYLRYAGVPEELRPAYAEAVPDYALADLLHAFLDRCARTLRPTGEIGFVTADRWLFNEGAAELRAALGSRLAIHHHERLDARTAFYRPKRRQVGTRIHPVAVVLRAWDEAHPALSRQPVYVDAAPIEGRPLGNVAQIRLAPWLGKSGIFNIGKQEASHLPPEALVPIVDTREIRGRLMGPLTRFAIRTHPDREPPAPVLAHLDSTLADMAPRGRRTPRWLPPETWHDWDLGHERLVVPRITQRLRCVRIPAGVLPVNHSLSIVTAEPDLLARLEAYLGGQQAGAWIAERAPRLEGGYLSITTGLLRQLPVPTAIERGGGSEREAV